MPKLKSVRYLFRTCHVCGVCGPVPKTPMDLKDPHAIFWASSPYAEEIYGEEHFAWWCRPCIRQDANDI